MIRSWQNSIITGPTREVAIARAKRALKQFKIEGVAFGLDFHRAVLNETDFTDTFNVHTRWIENDFKTGLKANETQYSESSTADVTQLY